MAARATAEWTGGLKDGSGSFAAGDALSGEFSYKSRFEDGPGANPEQLVAGAHASCFSMALSLILGEDGLIPDSIKTEAKVTLRLLDEGPAITRIDLSTVGQVPGMDEAAFVAAAEKAKAGCVISKALAGVEEINLEASLAS